MVLELGLEQKGEETPTRKKRIRVCRHNPVPSGWVMKHVLDVNHFLVWWPSTSYCLPFVPELPFWRVPTLCGSGERGNCYLLYHRCQKGQGTPFPSPLQPSQGGRGGLGSDWAKCKFAPRAPNPEHVRKHWGGAGWIMGDGVSHSHSCAGGMQGSSSWERTWGTTVFLSVLRRLDASHSSRLFLRVSVILWAQNSLLTNSFWFKINRVHFCCLQPRSLNGTDYG